MAAAAPLAGAEPIKLEKKPIKFSNLLRKAQHKAIQGDTDVVHSGSRAEHVRVCQASYVRSQSGTIY